MADWLIYRGSGEPHDEITRLPAPPPWRVFDGGPVLPPSADRTSHTERTRAVTYRPDDIAIQQVNAALYLRRPLLVTGRPGTGKTSLAYAVAHELRLGAVLRWTITSRSTLRDGLYRYDPLGRLYDASRRPDDGPAQDETLGDYLRLGPLGTALVPHSAPRVLLIDEIDKSDLDLPNDLLSLFEDGEYEIPELRRAKHDVVKVLDAAGDTLVPVNRGHVRCSAFPFVVMTSNGEREFPPAFLRRCVRLELRQPDEEKLKDIVSAHLPRQLADSDDIIRRFLERKSEGELATDQLLNAIYLTNVAAVADRSALVDGLLPYISGPPSDATLD